VIKLTEKEYKKIKALEKKFDRGVDEYCETLQDTWSFRQYFEEIMDIIDNAKEVK
jgi:hypothetical protein